ncbi:UNVERIFIED_CONTAM: hypothetical protein K2H54_045830 [Gekko kuhli]
MNQAPDPNGPEQHDRDARGSAHLQPGASSGSARGMPATPSLPQLIQKDREVPEISACKTFSSWIKSGLSQGTRDKRGSIDKWLERLFEMSTKSEAIGFLTFLTFS